MATPRGSEPAVFLDTSIHIAWFKTWLLHALITETLGRFAWKGSSSYSKVEYGNNVLSAVGYLLDKLKRFNDLEQLRHFMDNRLPHNAHYKKWFHNVLSKHFNGEDATERARSELEWFLTIGTDMVRAFSDEVRDGTQCPWAHQDTSVRRWQRPHDCRSKRPRCRLPEFFEDNRALFREIGSLIRSLPESERTDQLEGFADVVDQALDRPETLRDYSVCKRLADALIAVDSQGYPCLFTQNIRESQVLCRVLRQNLLCLWDDAAKGVTQVDYRIPPSQESASVSSPPQEPSDSSGE